MSRGKKALAIGGAVAGAAALGYGAKRFLGRKGARRTGRGSVARIRGRVQKLAYKVKEIQLKRKLFKEQMKI